MSESDDAQARADASPEEASTTSPDLGGSAKAAELAVESLKAVGLAPGDTIAGKYTVGSVLGEGGLGVVLSARHDQLDQQVAIKVLKPEMTRSHAVVERFLREGRLAAKIQSEHVVRVFDVGTLDKGAPYIVLEYLQGRDLGTILSDEGRLPIDKAVDYILEACEALAEAHSLGIVHRDLKPENLFVAQKAAGSTVVKILDFGISKLTPKGGKERWKRVTQDGDRFGTPAYMSPELLESATDASACSDVWSMGVVLYELLTGTLPFDGDEMPQLIAAVLHKPPLPLRARCPRATAELEHVLNKCLTKNPGERYRNVAELAQDLCAFGNPNTAPVRVAHIQAVVREVGDSIRPPTFPGGFRVRDLVKGTSSLSEEDARKAKTLTSWDAIAVPRRAGRKILLGVLAATVVASIIVVAMRTYLTRTSRHVTVADQPPSATAAIASAPAVDSAAPSASASASASAAAGVASAAGSTGSALPPTAASTGAPRHLVPRRAPGTGKPNKNAAFGERL